MNRGEPEERPEGDRDVAQTRKEKEKIIRQRQELIRQLDELSSKEREVDAKAAPQGSTTSVWGQVSDQRRSRPQTPKQGLVGLMAARVATSVEGSASSGSGNPTSLWANQPRAPITGTSAGVKAIVDTEKG